MKIILANGLVFDAVEVFPVKEGLSVWISGPANREDGWMAPPDVVLAPGTWIAYQPNQQMYRVKTTSVNYTVAS